MPPAADQDAIRFRGRRSVASPGPARYVSHAIFSRFFHHQHVFEYITVSPRWFERFGDLERRGRGYGRLMFSSALEPTVRGVRT